MKMPALSNAKARGKIRVDDKRRVDTADPLNAIFLEQRLAGKSPAAPAGAPVPSSATESAEIQGETVDEKRPGGEMYSLEREKKSIDIERARQELELSELKKQKIRGEVIPTAIVRTAFAQLFGAFSSSFKQEIENLIVEWTQIMHLNRNQQADLRKRLVKILNQGIDKGVEEAKTNIDNVVMEFRRDQ